MTFLATDAHTAVLPSLRDPRCSQPPKVWMQYADRAALRCCKRCLYGCQRCLEPPSVSIDLPNSLRLLMAASVAEPQLAAAVVGV